MSNLLNFAVINFREFAKFCSRKIALISLFAELNIRHFQTPGLGCKGPIKQGTSVRPSVCPSLRLSILPSFRLSVSFFRIDALVFSETWCHGVRGPYLDMCDRAGFFWEESSSGKNDQILSKMAQKHFLDFLGKLRHQFYLEFV